MKVSADLMALLDYPAMPNRRRNTWVNQAPLGNLVRLATMVIRGPRESRVNRA